MPERIVSHAERVLACKSFWRSRFGREATVEEVMSITGLSRARVIDPLPGGPVIPLVEQERLVCESCHRSFTRQRCRGRKPRQGPCCR